MAITSETVRVNGIRCERCVARLGGALRGIEGIESANANLMGEVRLAWDDERTSREEILDTMSKAGFRELAAASGE